MVDKITNSEIKRATDFDVFQWANEIDEYKNNVSCELFLFNKNYTPFKVRYSDKLTASVKAMFMQEAVSYIVKEADKGLEQREYEKSDGEDNVVYRTDLKNVTRAETLINLIEKEYKDMVEVGRNSRKLKGLLRNFRILEVIQTGMQKCFISRKELHHLRRLKGQRVGS